MQHSFSGEVAMVMIDTNLIIEQYNNILSEALPYNYLVRETELQQAKINELQEFKESIKQFRIISEMKVMN